MSDDPTPDRSIRNGSPRSLRWAWIAAASVAVGIVAIAAPARFGQLRTLCAGDNCVPPRITPDVGLELHDLGVSIDVYAAYVTGFEVMVALICAAVGVLILRHMPDDGFALFVGIVVAIGLPIVWLADGLGAIRFDSPVVANYLRSIGFAGFLLVGYLFPNGRFVPRWTWLIAVGMTIWSLIWPVTSLTLLSPTWVLFLVGWVSALVVAQAYRYLRVSTSIERQQTKWVMVGFAVAFLSAIVAIMLPPLLFPDSISPLNAAPSGDVDLIYRLFVVPWIGFAPPLLFPAITIGLAVLHYGLWEVDPMLNRALVYGSVSVMLFLVYLGLVAGLSTVIGSMTQGSAPEGEPGLALAISTLAVLALFRPLRARIQRVIDHRFYRRRYDATRAIADFNVRLRDKVDLDALQSELRKTVQQTMQPIRVSFWLRPDPTHVRNHGRANHGEKT